MPKLDKEIRVSYEDNVQLPRLYMTWFGAPRYTQDEAQLMATTQIVGGMIDSVRRLIERKAQPARGSLQITPRR